MKRHVLMAVMLAAGVTACSSGNDANNAKNEVTTAGVAQQWQLTMIDQQAISAEGSPTLNINKDMEVNGHTGCNRYFGQAELDSNRFKIDRMASTKMACAETAMALEQTMSQVLSQWSDASLRNNTLSLSNDAHTLVFTPVNSSKATDDPLLKRPAVNSRFNKGEKY
jgi:Heat shock protein